MDHPPIAIYDANVLYPAPIRDLLVRVAQAGLVRAKWTDAIHDEWIRSLLENNPQLSAERLARTRDLMNQAIRDCLVTGFEDLIDTLRLPDADDRHVLAAAIHCQADVIVTLNLKDFPQQILDGYDIRAVHPDDFLLELFEQAPGHFCAALKRQRESLRLPPMTADELLKTLENQGLVQVVARLRTSIDVL